MPKRVLQTELDAVLQAVAKFPEGASLEEVSHALELKLVFSAGNYPAPFGRNSSLPGRWAAPGGIPRTSERRRKRDQGRGPW